MFILDLIHKLIPIMGATEKGGGIKTGNKAQDSLYSLSNTDRKAIQNTAGDLAQLFTPTPEYGTSEQFARDNFISSAMQGVQVGMSIGGPVGGAVGVGFGLLNYAMNADARFEAERREREAKFRQWTAAVEQHKAGLRRIGKGLRAQDRALSYTKVAKLATAHGQASIAYDARLAASQSRGGANITAQRSALASKNTLEAIFAGQERILDAKLRDLDELQDLVDAEIDADRVFDYENPRQIKTEAFDELQEKTRRYEETY